MALEALGNYDHLPPTPFIRGLSIISTAVLFFAALNYLVKRLTYTSKLQDDTWKWRNLLISWIHAIIVGVWDLSCFYYYPELTTDLIAFNNMYIYSLVAFSTGYFLYDFMDIIGSGKTTKMWEVIPHHIAVAGMFLYNVVESRCVAYNVVALLSEVNTIFLHSRKLLQMHKWSFNHWLYRLNSALNLFTFLTCRFLGITWIVYGMFVHYHRVSKVYYWVLGASMFVMWVTNILLFWRLLQSDVIRPYMKKLQSRPNIFQHNGCQDDLSHIQDKNMPRMRKRVLTGVHENEDQNSDLRPDGSRQECFSDITEVTGEAVDADSSLRNKESLQSEGFRSQILNGNKDDDSFLPSGHSSFESGLRKYDAKQQQAIKSNKAESPTKNCSKKFSNAWFSGLLMIGFNFCKTLLP